mmetsp:Transcript_22455/g.35636  ORF Transcript_22455/g.35636 Transcript_22455/m.35636 type:complete len:252 (+) Transcript_22455:666-1421(+)
MKPLNALKWAPVNSCDTEAPRFTSQCIRTHCTRAVATMAGAATRVPWKGAACRAALASISHEAGSAGGTRTLILTSVVCVRGTRLSPGFLWTTCGRTKAWTRSPTNHGCSRSCTRPTPSAPRATRIPCSRPMGRARGGSSALTADEEWSSSGRPAEGGTTSTAAALGTRRGCGRTSWSCMTRRRRRTSSTSMEWAQSPIGCRAFSSHTTGPRKWGRIPTGTTATFKGRLRIPAFAWSGRWPWTSCRIMFGC